MTFEPYVRCFRCGTSRPQNMLLGGVCKDSFCLRVLKLSMDGALRSWWPDRSPRALHLREDMQHEAALAAWLSRTRASFHTYVFFQDADRSAKLARGRDPTQQRRRRTTELKRLPSADRTDHPTLLKACLGELINSFERDTRGFRDARIMTRLELGESPADAAQREGLLRQRHQIQPR